MKEHSESVDGLDKVNKPPLERQGIHSSSQLHPGSAAVDMRGSLN